MSFIDWFYLFENSATHEQVSYFMCWMMQTHIEDEERYHRCNVNEQTSTDWIRGHDFPWNPYHASIERGCA